MGNTFAALWTTLLCALAPAQVLTVPSGSLVAGSKITIHYSDPAQAGKKVVVDMDDGDNPPRTDQVTILLDRHGNGSVTWIVPFWDLVNFNAPLVDEQTRFVEPWKARQHQRS